MHMGAHVHTHTHKSIASPNIQNNQLEDKMWKEKDPNIILR